jgi:hypothetical protein
MGDVDVDGMLILHFQPTFWHALGRLRASVSGVHPVPFGSWLHIGTESHEIWVRTVIPDPYQETSEIRELWLEIEGSWDFHPEEADDLAGTLEIVFPELTVSEPVRVYYHSDEYED